MSLVEPSVARDGAAFPDHAERPSGWMSAGIALAVAAAALGVGVAFSAAVVMGVKLAGVPLQVSQLVGLSIGAKIMGDLMSLVVLFWAIRWLAGRDALLAVTGPGAPVAWWTWGAVIVMLYAVKAVAVMAGGLMTGDAPSAALEAVQPFADVMKSSVWLLLLLTGVVAAVTEEFIFRGYLSRVLEATGLGLWGGALVSALIWAGMHVYYPLSAQLSLVAVGVALSVVRARTGSLYPGMAWHILNNTVALLALRAIGG